MQTRLLTANTVIYQDRVRRQSPKQVIVNGERIVVHPKTFTSGKRQAKKDAQALLEGAQGHNEVGEELLGKIQETSTRRLMHLNF